MLARVHGIIQVIKAGMTKMLFRLVQIVAVVHLSSMPLVHGNGRSLVCAVSRLNQEKCICLQQRTTESSTFDQKVA